MSKDIKKALEHCVEWNCDNCPNGDELGSGETVCRGRLLPEVLEYVADIEAKLAERTEQLKIALKDFNDIQQENDKLAQQLEEKDKEIEYQESMKILAVKNQNQKAIAELEKVKEWMNKSDDDGYIFRFASMDTREKFNQKLDQQIKSLKGEKK